MRSCLPGGVHMGSGALPGCRRWTLGQSCSGASPEKLRFQARCSTWTRCRGTDTPPCTCAEWSREHRVRRGARTRGHLSVCVWVSYDDDSDDREIQIPDDVRHDDVAVGDGSPWEQEAVGAHLPSHQMSGGGCSCLVGCCKSWKYRPEIVTTESSLSACQPFQQLMSMLSPTSSMSSTDLFTHLQELCIAYLQIWVHTQIQIRYLHIPVHILRTHLEIILHIYKSYFAHMDWDALVCEIHKSPFTFVNSSAYVCVCVCVFVCVCACVRACVCVWLWAYV